MPDLEEVVLPSYYAIIPADVRYDQNLKANEKLLYAEITTLTNKSGICWASNQYFAKLYGVTPQAVSRWINNLKDYGYIDLDYIYQSNSKEINKRIIKLVSTKSSEVSINNLGVSTKSSEGYQQKVKENNTSKSNNKNEEYKYIISYLNTRAGTNFKYSNKTTQSLINARMREGFKVKDFERVIDTKCSEWLNDSKMRPYLRPQTLFGTKFESYLNQNSKSVSSLDFQSSEKEIEIPPMEIKFKKPKLRTGLEDLIKGGVNG